jgi:hypothetical protein
MHTVAILAYTAGLLDGEGSFTIGVSRNRRGRIAPSYWLQVGITNTDRALLDWLLATFGGHISDNSRAPSKKNKRPCWAWRIMGCQAVPFLRAVAPYVRIKHKQLLLAIEFQQYMSQPRQQKHLSEADLAQREGFRQQLRLLNRPSSGSEIEKLGA